MNLRRMTGFEPLRPVEDVSRFQRRYNAVSAP